MAACAPANRRSAGMKRRPFYLAAPGDVVAIEAEAETILDQLLPCSAKELLLGAGRQRLDLNVMVLYRACFRGANGVFVKQIEAISSKHAPLSRHVRVIIGPGLNFRKHPEIGADGRLLADIAARVGAKAEILDVDPRGAASTNGATIAERLLRLNDEPAWLVSISKGTADARAAFTLIGHWPKGVSGWINLSGVFQGTPVADRITNSTLVRLASRMLLTISGVAL